MQILNLKFTILILSLLFLLQQSSYGAALLPISEKQETSKCIFQTVSRVIDGDTFELLDGARIRLIGVDTPETVDPRKNVQWFGREASKKLKEWIENETVCLRQDRDKTQNIDKYGRLLRYAWKYSDKELVSDNDLPHEKENHFSRGEGFFVNAEIIKQGYGFAYTTYPFEHLEDFRKYERDARENNRGLWDNKKQEAWEKEVEKNKAFAKSCGKAETICPEDAINHIGLYKTIRFFIKKSYDSGKAVFFNSKNDFKDYDNFTAVIFETDKNNFPPQPADFYWGKTVDVTGKIKKYEGRAEIIMGNSSQIKIVK